MRESCSVGQNAKKKKRTPCVTPLRSCEEHIQTLQPQMKVLLWSPGIRFKPLFRSGVSSEVSRAAAEQCFRCVKTARRTALSETRARRPLSKVPRFLFGGAHISDVLLFLRREERGRGVDVRLRDPAEDSGRHLPLRVSSPRRRSTCRTHTAPATIRRA